MKKKLLFLLAPLALLSALSTQANTYTVTSGVNGTTVDGVSLRWAITQANSNPGSIIAFNIPGRAPQYINLTASLPVINNAGTIIDGSTQPANGFTGISPKIIIDGGGTVNNGLTITAANCELYGVCITHMSNSGNGITINATATNFIIGAPNKGNVINNIPGYGSGISLGGINGGTIQGNKIGTDTTGTVSSSVYNGITAGSSTKNILIGGGGAGQGNLISGQAGPNSCNIILQSSTHITIQGNIIGPGINMNHLHGSTISDGIYLLGADSCIIGGAGPGQGNIIGYDIDTTSTIGAGIQNQGTHADLISRNSIFCCGNWGGLQSISGNNNFPVPVITSAYTNIINGTATAKSTVEVFYNQSGCTTTIYGCSGETYLGIVVANSSGMWSLNGTFTGGLDITATATDSANNTSAFANCFPISLTTNVINLSDNTNFRLYPNPVSTYTNLEVSDNLLSQGCEFRLYDIFGREAIKITLSQNNTIINKNNLANGVYFYQLVSNGTVAGQGKLVVK